MILSFMAKRPYSQLVVQQKCGKTLVAKMLAAKISDMGPSSGDEVKINRNHQHNLLWIVQ